ncbi:MAG TPA: small ribosomal subunit Rsm22 family protein, partial [Candidatus Kapabacteria bacterium]|nr:small ribosomal subunit Rsm22 family protein [Candidatus Kapabacteria bacterium]
KFIQSVAKAVTQISHGLTKDRESFVASRYLTNAELQRAYLAYYTTTNLLKLWPPLRELAISGFFAKRDKIKQIDIGSGTGAAIWGLATYLLHEQPNITKLIAEATDSLPKNLNIIERFATKFQNHLNPFVLNLHTSHLDLSVLKKNDGSQYDLITIMNVLNEVEESHDAAIVQNLSAQLADGGAIITIEPATREESRRALRFRDRMVASGFHVYAPCCRTGGCPALIDEDNWCHTEIRWQRPDFIEEIDDIAGTLRLSLKSTYAIFVKEDLNLSDFFLPARNFFDVGRVVSERFDEKGRTRMFACNERGRTEYVMNNRDRTDGNKSVSEIERYDLFKMENIEVRQHDIKIGKDGLVNMLCNAEGSVNVDNLE